MTKTNVPRLRFSEFSGEWNNIKFNRLYKKNTEKNEEKFDKSKTISISKMRFNTLGNGASESSIKNYRVLRIGDVAFEGHQNKNFEFGRFVLNDVGDGIMSPRFTSLKPVNNQYIPFMKYLLHLEKIIRPILVKSTKAGTMMNELVLGDLLKQYINIPSYLEQQKIGDFFAKQDKLIELQTQKVDQLKKLKRGYLQKMFPQEGETVPRLRFSGFSGEWKKVTLGECYSINTGKSKYFINDNGKYAIAGSKGIIGYDSDYDYSGSFVMVSRVGEAGSMYELDGKLKITDNTIFIQTNYNKYLSGLLTNRNINKLSQGSGRRIIKSSDLKRMKINSANFSEQKKINDCIILIDKILELELKKLNELKRQKKSYLQKMFI